MSDRLEFQGKLQGVLELAKSKGQKIALEEVEKYFEEDQLNKEQLQLVCEYLLAQKVAVSGFEKNNASAYEEEQEQKSEEVPALSDEERKYVESYLLEIKEIRAESAEEMRMASLFPKVVEEAVKLNHPQVFIGDVIQEGNVSLMQALSEMPEAQDISIMEEVRAGMLALIEAQTEVKRQDKRMVEQVSELDEAIRSMTEELGRKVAVDELAERLGIKEEQIAEILKLAGEDVDN